MKHLTIYLFLFVFSLNSAAQNINLQLTGKTIAETKVIDSLNYLSKHKNIKSITNEIQLLSKKLSNIGFIENDIISETKISDSTYNAKLNLGERIKTTRIYIGTNSILKDLLHLNHSKDTIVLPYIETESFLAKNLHYLEKNGYAFATIKLINIQKKGSDLFASLEFKIQSQRKLNSILIKYDKPELIKDFPKGYLTQMNHKYRNKIFNQKLLTEIHADFEKYSFVTQIKYPEILFTKDTTKVYVYLQKTKTNTFDGFIGFNNDNKKITFNGYFNLNLQNLLQAGEQFSLYWKSDGSQQKTFRTTLEVPYIFKSPLGLRAELNIFKQDSTFQNTKTIADLSYYVKYDTRIYLGYQATNSSDIQNASTNEISDYKSSYLTTELAYFKLDAVNPLFSKKSNLSIKAGIGKRQTNNQIENNSQTKQTYISLLAMHTFNLNLKNTLNIRSYTFYLQSNNFIINELFRFGGVNSIRGFAENSLQANFMTTLLTEYRYIVSPSLYFHTIMDYCKFRDPIQLATSRINTDLFGFGLGIGIQAHSGLLAISIANGSAKSPEIKADNTIVHINYNVKF